MASAKRELQPQGESEPEQPESKKARSYRKRVVLNPADCNLDFNIENDGVKGFALHEGGFAYCWSGARANVGITAGKYCFGCKVIAAQTVNMEDTPPDQQHVCRIGISRGDDAVGNLGETSHSFGFGGTGKFSTAGKFSDYGENFGVGDIIVCAVDLESRPLASIGFSKNGKWLGIAREFNAGPTGLGVVDSPTKQLQWESALFAHVLLKNVEVQLQFSAEDGLVPEEGYQPWASAIEDGNAIMGPVFPDIKDCEVMMMVGLPASGKTTWAEKWVKEHPERRYVLLGTNLVLDQMKVPGLLRKKNYGERFDRLISQANEIFDILLTRAARTPRNYVIDQTNVFKSARKRKLRPFANFHKIAVVVFPKPEELKFRAKRRFEEMGKEVPADAVNNMLANYVLPTSKDMLGSDEFFDQVIFTELGREESQEYLEDMKLTLKTNFTPHIWESSVTSSTGPSGQNEGALSVSGGQWESSYPPHPPLVPTPRPVNNGYQVANQVNQGQASSSGTYQIYQYPSVVRAPVPYSTYENYVPQHNSGYSGGYGAIPGGRPDTYHQSYGAVDAYRCNLIEANPGENLLSSSFACNTAGGHQARPQATRAPTYPSYGSSHGRPWSLSPSSTPSRPQYGNYPGRYY
ncbi:hypothetical protein JCGZ_21354 [Jatropha curcas]|uniref:SPRY domain-containing protein n=1 Tax=Jatropha curcas TaxID=180498 RepID=A0A067JDP4_JATCU|nr:heterogeneous nuclear ribonucleoprotein U-like protein 1 [Jatropha curcas]KDP20883.1 hypothetical protein JCGZ_21354 [Jatropha curcas]